MRRCPRARRAVTQRVRSRCLSALRKPNAARATSLITRLMPSLLALLSGVDECGGLGPSAVDGDGELPHLRDVGIRAPCEQLPAGLADLVPVGASSGQSEEAAQVLLGDPCPQQGLPDCPSPSAFHIVANCSSVRSSRLRSRRRRADHSRSVTRPRRPRTSAVVRRRAAESMLHHVEAADHDPGVRQAGADPGAVGGGHVDGDVCDALSPGQRGGGEPARRRHRGPRPGPAARPPRGRR